MKYNYRDYFEEDQGKLFYTKDQFDYSFKEQMRFKIIGTIFWIILFVVLVYL